jgi:ELWxxDGT repeat protein
MDNELVSTSERAFFVSSAPFGTGVSAADPATSSIAHLAGINYHYSPIEIFRMFPMGEDVYFSGRHEVNYQLLKSDGSPEGTTVVKKLALSGIPNPIVSQPSNGKMLFHSDINPHGNLWITDGTASGTVALGNYSPPLHMRKIPIESTALGSQIVFVGHDATNGYQPWITDGTASGTMLLKNIQPGGSAVPHNSLINADQYVYFRADDGVHGFELWRTDGTSEGTVMVQDINPGPDSSMPYHITYANGHLIFSADDGTNGHELWVIPPGETEPEMVKVAPQGTASDPRFLGIMPGPYEIEADWHVKAKFNVLNSRVVFQADHPDFGNDLWALPLDADSSVTDWNLY